MRTPAAEITALLNSGRFEDHTTLKLTLTDATVVRLATGQIQIGADLYLGQLKESDPLILSLTPETDRAGLKIQNVDKVFGQTVLNSDSLVGAIGVLGLAFKDLDTGATYLDEKISGTAVAGEVDETSVAVSLVGEIYGALMLGETVSANFPFKDQQPVTILQDPNDILDPNADWDAIWRIGGRLPFLDFYTG